MSDSGATQVTTPPTRLEQALLDVWTHRSRVRAVAGEWIRDEGIPTTQELRAWLARLTQAVDRLEAARRVASREVERVERVTFSDGERVTFSDGMGREGEGVMRFEGEGLVDRRFEDLKGETVDRMIVNGARTRVDIMLTNGRVFQLYHEQDCCESVRLLDCDGDINGEGVFEDCAGEVIDAQCVSREATDGEVLESGRWTFYRITTQAGTVILRWLGESNGYYSESVTFSEIDPKTGRVLEAEGGVDDGPPR